MKALFVSLFAAWLAALAVSAYAGPLPSDLAFLASQPADDDKDKDKDKKDG